MPLNGRNNNKRALECHTLYNNGNRKKLFVYFQCHISILTENEKIDRYKRVLKKRDFRNENWLNINCLIQVSLQGKFICEKKLASEWQFGQFGEEKKVWWSIAIVLINIHINVPSISNGFSKGDVGQMSYSLSAEVSKTHPRSSLSLSARAPCMTWR